MTLQIFYMLAIEVFCIHGAIQNEPGATSRPKKPKSVKKGHFDVLPYIGGKMNENPKKFLLKIKF